MLHSRITHKKARWGGRFFTAPFSTSDLISFVGSLEIGNVSDEFGRIYGSMLLEGTRKHSKKELQLILDQMGASVDFFVKQNRLYITAQVRSPHWKQFLTILHEMLSQPLFEANTLAVLKKREEAYLALDAQDTRRQATIALTQALFPIGHPNRLESSQDARKELKHITHTTLHTFHTRVLNRRTLIAVATGNVTSTTLHTLEKIFETLPNVLPLKKKIPTEKNKKIAHIAIALPDKVNIDYCFGQRIALHRDHADFPALLLGMQIIGNPGGFSGRLMKTVREKEGLTYGVYGYTAGFFEKIEGYVFFWGTFAASLFMKGRTSMKEVVQEAIQKGITERETKEHQRLYAGRYLTLSLATSSAFAQLVHDTVLSGKPLSYLDTFPKKIRSLKYTEVNKVLRKYIKPQFFSEAAAGPIEKNVFRAYSGQYGH